MGAPSLTYTLTNGSAADASQVMQDFNDLLNGITDGTKDLSINGLTVAGTATFNGACNFGNATGDDMTFTGYIASNLLSKTSATYALGSTSQPWKALYLDNGATDSGAVYFDAGSTKYLKGNAAGTQLSFGGWTTLEGDGTTKIGSSLLAQATFTAPTVQKLTSGTNATYTTPTSPRTPLYIVVECVGGGGGGGGSGTASSSSDGGNGGDTTFNPASLNITAGGGHGGYWGGSSGLGGAAGTASLGSATGLAMTGNPGGNGPKIITISTVELGGGFGAPSIFGGGGKHGTQGGGGSAAATNSGGGGGGAGHSNTANSYNGTGGGSGGYVKAIIGSPGATYTYTVGTGGTSGSAGTNGFGGGAGAAGIIFVTEFYQ